MLKKLLAVLIGIFVLTGLASGFELEVEEVNDRATTDNPAEFKINIENPASEERTFQMNVLDYHRRWYSYERRITVDSRESKYFNLTINPRDDAIQDIYRTDFSITDLSSEERKTDSVRFRVVRDRNLNVESYRIENSVLEPGESLEVSVDIRNVGSSTIEGENLKFETLNTSKSSDLDPLTAGGLRTVTKEFEINDTERPGLKEILLETDGREYVEEFNVSEVNEIRESSEIDNRIFVVSEERVFENQGNTEETHVYEREVPNYISPVFYAPDAEEHDSDQGKVYTWEFNLSPGETGTATMRIDYWIPISGLVVLLTGFLVLKKITSSVRVVKTVEFVEGKLNVTIEVENNSSKVFSDVVLQEFVPNVLDMSTDFDMANPEVKHSSDGSNLKWWINELEPGDQRIFKYSVKPKVEVEEGITIRPSILKDGERELASSEELEAKFDL